MEETDTRPQISKSVTVSSTNVLNGPVCGEFSRLEHGPSEPAEARGPRCPYRIRVPVPLPWDKSLCENPPFYVLEAGCISLL